MTIESGITLVSIGVNNNKEVQIECDLESITEQEEIELCHIMLGALDRIKYKVHMLIDELEYSELDEGEDEEKPPWE